MSAYLETEHRKPAASNADRELAYARRLIVHARDSLDAPRLGIAEVTRAIDELTRALGLMRSVYAERRRERDT